MSVRRASATTTCSGVSTRRTPASRPGEQRAHLVELGVEPLDGREDRVVGHRDAGRARQHRPQGLHHAALGREDPVHVPPQGLGQREQPQRLGGGRAVDDDRVPVAREGVQAQLEQRQHLLGAGDDGQLLGGDRVDAGDLEHREQVALDLRPGLLEPPLRVDLLHEQAGRDLLGLMAHGDAEGVGQRVGGVGGQHQRAATRLGGEGRGRGGDRRLPDPALAGEQQDAH